MPQRRLDFATAEYREAHPNEANFLPLRWGGLAAGLDFAVAAGAACRRQPGISRNSQNVVFLPRLGAPANSFEAREIASMTGPPVFPHS